MYAAVASRFCIDLLELSRVFLGGERGATADDTDTNGARLGWFPGRKVATADAAMAAHLSGVLAWLRVSILEWIHQPPCSWSGGEAPLYLVSSWGGSPEDSCGG